MGKGKELEFPEGWGGGRSSQSELNLMALRAIEARGQLAVRGFPLIIILVKNQIKNQIKNNINYGINNAQPHANKSLHRWYI
jgi:hypothetical protein